jgi:hypothetical protein
MLSPRLLQLLRDWWWVGRPSTWLFPGRDPLLPITSRQLYRVVEEAAAAAEIKTRVTPHTLRHSFATHPPKRRACGISLCFQYALVSVGSVSFALSSPQPALHLPSASNVPPQDAYTDCDAHRNLIDGLVRANSFPQVTSSPRARGNGKDGCEGLHHSVLNRSSGTGPENPSGSLRDALFQLSGITSASACLSGASANLRLGWLMGHA